MIEINKIATNDVFSESSLYRTKNRTKDSVVFTHIASGEEVVLNNEYVLSFLSTASQYHSEEIVGKEDKFWTAKQIADANKKTPFKEGEEPKVDQLKQLGIRSIWDSIARGDVFTVWFKKADKPYSAKKLKELKEAQRKDAIEKIEKAKLGKKGVADVAAKALEEIQDNPILPYELGETRKLTGAKKDFRSLTGFFDVHDLDILEEDNIRKVNVNTIEALVWKDVKYTVEK